jgi:hypothetical protein
MLRARCRVGALLLWGILQNRLDMAWRVLQNRLDIAWRILQGGLGTI